MTILETATEALEKDIRVAWRLGALNGTDSDLEGYLKLARSTVSIIISAAKHEGAMEELARMKGKLGHA